MPPPPRPLAIYNALMPPIPLWHSYSRKMWHTHPSSPSPDDTPSHFINESSPLLHGSIIHGKQQRVKFSCRAAYTNLPNIEEGAHNEQEYEGTKQKIEWKKILLKGLKYVLLMGFLVGMGFGAVATSYPGIFNSGL